MSADRKQAVVAGGFDDLKSRQIRFLQEASGFGELTVLLWSDDMVRRVEGKRPKFPEAERSYFLRAIRYVHNVRLVHGRSGGNVLADAGDFRPEVWVVPEADDSADVREFCHKRGLHYVVLRDEQLKGFPDATAEPVVEPEDRKRVIVTGCYDWFHSGHVRFFEEAAGYGDLYVVVGHDANVRLLKGENRPLFPQEERRYIAGSIRFVKQALVSTGHGWLDAEPEIQRIRPHIYAVNEDGDVPEKREYCEQHGIEYLVLKRTPAPGLAKRSSTNLRGF